MRKAALAVTLFLLAGAASAQTTTYTYTGSPYTTALPPYALGGQLTGSFTVASPLPAFLPLTDITPSLAAMSFNDTVATRTLANSFVCSFNVATDGAGNITQWQITLRQSPFTTGNPQHSIDSSGTPGGIGGNDLGGTGNAGPGPCDPMALTTFASSSAEGSWTDNNPLASQPTTYNYTGDPYTSAVAPYSLGGQLTGTFTTANPLPPFLPLTDITPALATMSFNDTVETRTLANSFLCSFQVATDGAGNITQWVISLRRSPYNPGDPHHSISSSGNPGAVQGIDSSGTGTAPAGPCDPMVQTTFGSTATQGSWTDNNPLASQPTTYNYTGDPYTSVTPPYVLGGQLTGSITTANPLPAFLPLTDITAALTSLSFNDTVETRTLANSFLCSVKVGTDGAGNITQWQISLARSPYNPGDPHHSISSTGTPGLLEGTDLSGTGTAPASPCGGMVLTSFGSTATEGTWTDTNAQPSVPTTYHYVGDPYTTATAPYVLGGQVLGSITLANPLPPHMPLTDITPSLTALAFNDGVETRTLATSFLCSVQVATDGAGNITEWQIFLRRFPYNPGDPIHGIESSGRPGVIQGNDLVGTGPAPASPCGAMIYSPFASTATQGTWLAQQASAAAEVPALDGIALAVLGLLLAGVGVLVVKRM